MKRSDAFMVVMSAFVAVNCLSYFVHSGLPFVSGWGMRARGMEFEALGCPLCFYCVSFGGPVAHSHWSWINLTGNVGVAVIVACAVCWRFADRLPPLWIGHAKVFRFSLIELMFAVTLACVLLGTGMISATWGLWVRNMACFVGPISVYAWHLHRSTLSWVGLTIAMTALTLIAIILGFRYEDPRIDGSAVLMSSLPPNDASAWALPDRDLLRHTIARTVVRATVPVWGTISLLVVAPTFLTLLYPHVLATVRTVAEIMSHDGVHQEHASAGGTAGLSSSVEADGEMKAHDITDRDTRNREEGSRPE